MIEIKRKTAETSVTVQIKNAQDELLQTKVEIGVPFFEHMLKAMIFYAGLEVSIDCKGDLHVDEHHSLEDVGIVMGEALLNYYKAQNNFKRFSSCYVPMDEALVRAVLDISGRPYFQIDGLDLGVLSSLEQSMIEFMRSFVINARMTVHIDVIKGFNRHHIFEAIFKAIGFCLKESLITSNLLMSTKGSIG